MEVEDRKIFLLKCKMLPATSVEREKKILFKCFLSFCKILFLFSLWHSIFYVCRAKHREKMFALIFLIPSVIIQFNAICVYERVSMSPLICIKCFVFFVLFCFVYRILFHFIFFSCTARHIRCK